MSSGKESSYKPSTDTSSAAAQDDDCLTWLQYPTDDAFEKSYCSNLFQWAWPQVTVTEGQLTVPSNPDVFTHEHEVSVSSSIATSSCQTDVQSSSLAMCSNMGARTALNSRPPSKINAEEALAQGTKTALNSRPPSKINAEEALAQGAARAAGRSWPMGASLQKIRTLMQPTDAHPPLAISSHSFNTCEHLTDHTIKLNLPISSLPTSAPNSLQNAKSMRVNKSDSYSPTSKVKRVTCEPTAFSSKRSRMDYESHMDFHQPESSRITEAGSSRRGKEALVSDQLKWARTSTSYSGASQTSMSVSGRRTTYSERLKQEDSELLLDDFTEDDSTDTKKQSKLPLRRNRVPEAHNLSERIRRNKINEKLKALQDLVPNSSKTDKASVLDEAIEYMKTLQTQLQMVSMRSSLNVSTMMMPMNLPQTHLPMAQPPSVGIGVPVGHPGMGIGLGVMQDAGRPMAAPLFQCPTAMMSQMHAMPFHSQNMAGFAHFGFPQSAQILPAVANMQERSAYVHQHQDFMQGWPVIEPCRNSENDVASIEQDDISE